MNVRSASVTIVTDNLIKTCEFYTIHFDAHIVFDCGWYVVLRLGPDDAAPKLNIMSPQDETPALTQGLFINFKVDNADDWLGRFEKADIAPVMPIETHPWGDRGFAVKDPAGSLLYCYHTTKPADDFRQYFHE